LKDDFRVLAVSSDAQALLWMSRDARGEVMELRSSQVRVVLAICILFLSVGCASFPGKQLPLVEEVRQKEDEVIRPFDYSITVQFQGRESSAKTTEFEDLIGKTLDKAGLFDGYRPGIGDEGIHLNLVLNNHGDIVLAALSGFASGYTFGILPGYAKDNYQLTVDVEDAGQVVKSYEYNDYMSTWIGWIFLPMMPGRVPKDVGSEVVGNMLMHFIQDACNDGVLVQHAILPDEVPTQEGAPPQEETLSAEGAGPEGEVPLEDAPAENGEVSSHEGTHS